MTMMPLLWRHLYLEQAQSVQYFAQLFYFITRQALNNIESYNKNERTSSMRKPV